jgi:hypothetical protein
LEPWVTEPFFVRAVVAQPLALPKPEVVRKAAPSPSIVSLLALDQAADIEVTAKHVGKRFHPRIDQRNPIDRAPEALKGATCRALELCLPALEDLEA